VVKRLLLKAKASFEPLIMCKFTVHDFCCVRCGKVTYRKDVREEPRPHCEHANLGRDNQSTRFPTCDMTEIRLIQKHLPVRTRGTWKQLCSTCHSAIRKMLEGMPNARRNWLQMQEVVYMDPEFRTWSCRNVTLRPDEQGGDTVDRRFLRVSDGEHADSPYPRERNDLDGVAFYW
jgi:hypothetical protein